MAFGQNDFRDRLQTAMTGGGPDAETPADAQSPDEEAETCPTCGASVKKIQQAAHGSDNGPPPPPGMMGPPSGMTG